MQLSIREGKARFSEAVDAASRGEVVTITRHGQVVAELRAPAPAAEAAKAGFWERMDRVRAELGIEVVDNGWPEEFDDPAYSRRVLGLED